MILDITKEEQLLLLDILPKIQAPAISKEVDIIRGLFLKIRDAQIEADSKSKPNLTEEVELNGNL